MSKDITYTGFKSVSHDHTVTFFSCELHILKYRYIQLSFVASLWNMFLPHFFHLSLGTHKLWRDKEILRVACSLVKHKSMDYPPVTGSSNINIVIKYYINHKNTVNCLTVWVKLMRSFSPEKTDYRQYILELTRVSLLVFWNHQSYFVTRPESLRALTLDINVGPDCQNVGLPVNGKGNKAIQTQIKWILCLSKVLPPFAGTGF